MNRNRKRSLLLVIMLVSTVYGRSSELARAINLEYALGVALEHNYKILQARSRIRQQEGIVTTVAAPSLPQIAASASVQDSSTLKLVPQTSGPIIFSPSGLFWRMNVTASQTLYAGGGIRAAMDKANLTRDAAVFDLQATITQVLLDVRLRFYAALLAKAQIEVEQSNLEVLQRQMRDANNRFEVGSASRFEALRAEVAVANAKPPLIKARNDFRLALEELRQAMGLERSSDDPEVPLSIDGSFAIEPFSTDLGSALGIAKIKRPELQRLAKLVAAADAGENVALAGYRPQIGASIGGELRKGQSGEFDDSLKGWQAGLNERWSVTPLQTAGRVRQAESIAAQTRLSLEEMELIVQVEVRRAFASMEQASELVAATLKSVQQAEEAARIADVRYKAGSSTQLELLQAQAALTTARTNQLRATYAHSTAVARLRQAIGASEVEHPKTQAADASHEDSKP